MKTYNRKLFRIMLPLIRKFAFKYRWCPEKWAVSFLIRGIKAEQRTMVNRPRLENLYRLCSSPSLPDGAFVECGVGRGGCVALMAFIAKDKRPVWGFDSFEGLPDLTEEDEGEGKKAVGWNISGPDGFGGAQKTLDRFCVSAESVKLVKGWFEETLPIYRSQLSPIAVLRLDGDWHTATRYCLESLYDAVAAGGAVIIDDYHAFIGCRKATDQFRAERGIESPLITTDVRSEAYWFKTA